MQEYLFENTLKRFDLLNIPKKNITKNIVINVFRNHSFEMIENIMTPFLNYSGIFAKYNYSDYDDSLNYGNLGNADINIVWLDLGRYKNINIKKWVTEKVEELYSITRKPVIFAYTSNKKINIKFCSSNIFSFWINDEIDIAENQIYDYVKESYTGTVLSNKTCIQLARVFGLKYIPAILGSKIKTIIFDLDNTLYNGILGEDGIDGIEITETHKKIYLKIKELRQKGILVCLASKNEEADVVELFKNNADLTLKFDDFLFREINWNSKADNIKKMIQQMNVGADAVLFIDDNPAELQNVEGLGVKTILAKNPDVILNVLNYYPGIMKTDVLNEDLLRANDIKSNQKREKFVNELSPKEYFEKLKVKLEFNVNKQEQYSRIYQLMNKTNQFILTYARYDEEQVKELANNGVIVTISMSDILSDSGIIAILAATKNEDNSINVNELTISCRALGRNLEEIMINKLFEVANIYLKTNSIVKINYKKGSRNMPAISCIEHITNQKLQQEGCVEYLIPANIDTSGLDINMKEVINV